MAKGGVGKWNVWKKWELFPAAGAWLWTSRPNNAILYPYAEWCCCCGTVWLKVDVCAQTSSADCFTHTHARTHARTHASHARTHACTHKCARGPRTHARNTHATCTRVHTHTHTHTLYSLSLSLPQSRAACACMHMLVGFSVSSLLNSSSFCVRKRATETEVITIHFGIFVVVAEPRFLQTGNVTISWIVAIRFHPAASSSHS